MVEAILIVWHIQINWYLVCMCEHILRNLFIKSNFRFYYGVDLLCWISTIPCGWWLKRMNRVNPYCWSHSHRMVNSVKCFNKLYLSTIHPSIVMWSCGGGFNIHMKWLDFCLVHTFVSLNLSCARKWKNFKHMRELSFYVQFVLFPRKYSIAAPFHISCINTIEYNRVNGESILSQSSGHLSVVLFAIETNGSFVLPLRFIAYLQINQNGEEKNVKPTVAIFIRCRPNWIKWNSFEFIDWLNLWNVNLYQKEFFFFVKICSSDLYIQIHNTWLIRYRISVCLKFDNSYRYCMDHCSALID